MFALLLLVSIVSADKVIGKKLINYNYHFYEKDVCYNNIWQNGTFIKLIVDGNKIINQTHSTKECNDKTPKTEDISDKYEYHELPEHVAYCVFHFTAKNCPFEKAAPNLLLFKNCIKDDANSRSCSYVVKDKKVTETCVSGNDCKIDQGEQKVEASFDCDVCSEHVYRYSDNLTVTEYMTTHCKQFFEKKNNPNGSIMTSILVAMLVILALF